MDLKFYEPNKFMVEDIDPKVFPLYFHTEWETFFNLSFEEDFILFPLNSKDLITTKAKIQQVAKMDMGFNIFINTELKFFAYLLLITDPDISSLNLPAPVLVKRENILFKDSSVLFNNLTLEILIDELRISYKLSGIEIPSSLNSAMAHSKLGYLHSNAAIKAKKKGITR